LDSCWALLKWYRKAAGNAQRLLLFLKGIGKPLGNAKIPAISQRETRQNCRAAIGMNVAIFHPFSLNRCISVNVYHQSKELRKIFKILSGLSPIFVLSNHTTFSQTRFGAKVLS
jgi:hypothetical protein